jgi:hypothetical protein
VKGIFKPEDLAKKLGIAEQTLLDWRDIGMPYVKIGKLVFILEESFLRWLKSREKTGNAQDALQGDFFDRRVSNHAPEKN